jgi:hypothetical protein
MGSVVRPNPIGSIAFAMVMVCTAHLCHASDQNSANVWVGGSIGSNMWVNDLNLGDRGFEGELFARFSHGARWSVGCSLGYEFLSSRRADSNGEEMNLHGYPIAVHLFLDLGKTRVLTPYLQVGIGFTPYHVKLNKTTLAHRRAINIPLALGVRLLDGSVQLELAARYMDDHSDGIVNGGSDLAVLAKVGVAFRLQGVN